MESKYKITSAQKAQETINAWKQAGLKIVFTNGCFDIVHLGHVDYLEKARNLGDKLIVGINSDISVSNIKGINRPIVSQESRARVIAALGFVELVIIFDEETPYILIQTLLPDVLVKGNDYLAENIVGADIVKGNGGKIETIELVQGYSTSKIISKIQNLT